MAQHRDDRVTGRHYIAAMVVALFLLGAVAVMIPTKADAADWLQPYGGCKEAAGYTDSPGAQECRDHGWIVRKRIVVSPAGRVVVQRLPVCERRVSHAHCFVPFTLNPPAWPGEGATAYIVDTLSPHVVRTTTIRR